MPNSKPPPASTSRCLAAAPPPAPPFAQVAFHPYSARGDPAALLNGDFYAGKGVGWAALQTPGGLLFVFNVSAGADASLIWCTASAVLLPARHSPSFACHVQQASEVWIAEELLLLALQTHLSANYGQRWQWGAPGLPPECRLPRDALAGVRLLQASAGC